MQTENKLSEELLEFLHNVEPLKFLARTSITSRGYQDSVASHSWRVALIVIAITPHLTKKIDLCKALKMAIIHDLGELEAGDTSISTLESNPELASSKTEIEYRFFKNLKHKLSSQFSENLFELWNEFEDRKTLESQIVNAADKLEAFLQNIEASVPDPVIESNSNNFKRKICEFFDVDPTFKSILQSAMREYYEDREC